MAWAAQISLSFAEGWHHLYAMVDGDAPEEVHAAAQMIFDSFATGHETFVRMLPEAVSEKDFDSKITRHRAWTRISFRLEDGPHHLLGAGDPVAIPLSAA
jgi:hypothetical protein